MAGSVVSWTRTGSQGSAIIEGADDAYMMALAVAVETGFPFPIDSLSIAHGMVTVKTFTVRFERQIDVTTIGGNATYLPLKTERIITIDFTIP